MAPDRSSLVQTTARSLEILEILRELDGGSLTRIASETGLPASTTYNHLNTLVEYGFVVREDETYRLSLKLLDYGTHVKGLRTVNHVAPPEIEALAEETGEVACLMVEERGKGVYLHSAEGDHAIPLETGAGTHIPLHATALGKSIMAGLPDDRIDEILDQYGLPAFTEATISTREALFDELETIRENSVAYERGEYHQGLNGVATAIRDESGSVVGSIGILAPASRLTDDRLQGDMTSLLQQATNVIELTMAHT